MFDFFTYSETAPLDLADEVAAIEAAQAGDADAYARLLAAYGPTLRKTVGRASKTMDTEEAQAVALLAFAEVLHSHDPHSEAYADGRLAARLTPHLKDALGIAQASEAGPFRVPKRTYTRYLGILNAAEGDAVAARGLAPAYSMAADTFDEIHAMVRAAEQVDAAEGPDSEVRALELTYEPYSEVEDRVMVDMAFAAMADDEVRICELSYGFTEYEEQPDGEIAHRMGVSRPTVQRKRAKALSKARKALGVTPESE